MAEASKRYIFLNFPSVLLFFFFFFFLHAQEWGLIRIYDPFTARFSDACHPAFSIFSPIKRYSMRQSGHKVHLYNAHEMCKRDGILGRKYTPNRHMTESRLECFGTLSVTATD